MTDRKTHKTSLGLILRLFGHPAGIAILLAQFAVVVTLLAMYSFRRTDDGCLYCHADRAVMTELGYPQFTVTAEEAMEESGILEGL